jgi:hypothetical protein
MIELYNGKYKCEFSEAAHRYKINGVFKQGVTGALKLLSKEGLIQWAANIAAETAYKLAQQGVPMHEAIKEAKYAHVRKRDKSADTGKKVHKWIEEHLQGQDGMISQDMQPSVIAFLAWEEENKPEYVHSEKVVYSETYDYCGTFDLMLKLNGKTYMADIKTSDTDKQWDHKLKRYTGQVRARTEHFLQCAAYDQAYSEEFGLSCDAYLVIYVTKDGKLFTFERSDTDFLKETWLSVYKTFLLTKQLDFKNKFTKGG